MAKSSRTPCFRPVAVLMRLRLVRRCGDKARRKLAHNNHAKSTLRDACSTIRRPPFHGTIRARDAWHGIRTRGSRLFESPAADWSQCWCGRAWTDGVGRSAPRVGPDHPRQVHAARRMLRAPSAATPWCDVRVGRAPRDSNTLTKNLRTPSPTCCGVGAIAPRPTALGGARRMLARITSTSSPRCAARAPRSVGRCSVVRCARGVHATEFKRTD